MRHRKPDDEINFWQSSSDLMAALLMMFILIIILLMLYLRMVPEEKPDTESEVEKMYEWTNSNPEVEPIAEVTPTPNHDENDGGGGGGGGGGEDGDEEEEEEGEYPGDEEGYKSAVYVTLIDAETEKIVKEAGVTFALHSERGPLQILNTYYPQKITYRDYETTEEGTFYLPEKIPEGGYYLKNLTEASGYDYADDEHFVIDQLYDWPEPFIVKIPLSPAKNIIRIQMTDRETGEKISGGVFDVIAKEDIITLDGTLRNKKGDVVSTIVCDDDGYGESEELFLGEYEIRQKSAPDYYANFNEDIPRTLNKKSEDNKTAVIKNERTKIRIHLTDELDNARPITDAVFLITEGNDKGQEYTTDSKGDILLDSIEKDTTYHIQQISSEGDYLINEEETSVKVSKAGLIQNESYKEINLTNRILQVSIGVDDAILNSPVDASVAVVDKTGKTIKSWTSGGAEIFTDIPEGEYSLIVNGNTEKPYPLIVRNTADIQSTRIKIFTKRSYMVIGFVCSAVAIFIGVIIFIIKKFVFKGKPKKEKSKEKI